MNELLNAITDIVSNTPPKRVTHLAELIKSEPKPLDRRKLDAWAVTPAGKRRAAALIDAWNRTDIPAPELAGMLAGAAYAYGEAKAEETVELVWTGPSSEMIATRKTEQALLEVIRAAETKLFMTSFVAYKLNSIIEALEAALACGVAVSILLEASEDHGGGVSIDGIAAMKKALPEVRVYSWRERPDAFVGGKVHAKVAVADERRCFISSANLTGHAMEKNMEAGILVSGGTVPQNLHRHLDALAVTGVIERV
ncbi:DISARM system phospholipase D-like protein DrmC [Rhodosalinus sp. 5P4]|uniref:DISARM system phospholipase D-like protein DrmC n=1 Tax=Rhodosalinus sp. 5P4 TaxID=3239196 RepID=UPI0035247FA5